jgi:chorismate mutase
MPVKSKHTDVKVDYEELFGQMEDEQLLEVIEKRNLYQPEAASVAVRISIERGMFASEAELPAPRVREKHLKFKLFPVIENERIRLRIRRSVARMLFLSGLLPAIWGIVRFNSGFSMEGTVLIVYALLWMGSAAWLIRTYNSAAVTFLFVLAGLSLGYIIRIFLMHPVFVIMDFFIIAVLYLLMVYGLFFMTRLGK